MSDIIRHYEYLDALFMCSAMGAPHWFLVNSVEYEASMTVEDCIRHDTNTKRVCNYIRRAHDTSEQA